MKELAIGEVGVVAGETVRCVGKETCGDCFFWRHSVVVCNSIKCTYFERQDGKSVMFIPCTNANPCTWTQDANGRMTQKEKISAIFESWLISEDMSKEEVAFVRQYQDRTEDVEFMAHGFYAGYCMASSTYVPCTWAQDADGIWYTSCGQAQEFTTGTREENGYKFCPYCGNEITEASNDNPGYSH